MSPRRPGCWWRGAGQAAAGAAAARVLQPAAAEAARHVRVRQHAAAAARLLRPRPRRVPAAAVTPAPGLQVTIEISRNIYNIYTSSPSSRFLFSADLVTAASLSSSSLPFIHMNLEMGRREAETMLRCTIEFCAIKCSEIQIQLNWKITQPNLSLRIFYDTKLNS